MEFIAATNNPGKMAEMRRILERMGHTVRSQREAGVTLEPEENGTTFAENARIKARAICEAAGTATIADDSGLCVDALDGAPGVYSARYCGRHGDDEANNDKLLEELAGVPEGKRAARFVSSICVCLPGGRCAVFEGGARAAWALCAEGRTALGTTRCSSRTRWACRAAGERRKTRRAAPTPSFRPRKKTPSATGDAPWSAWKQSWRVSLRMGASSA